MLETIDLNKSLAKEEYIRDLIRYQVALHALGYQVYVQQRPVIMVFEGWDAAGKGGVIKRVTEKLDPRGYVVHLRDQAVRRELDVQSVRRQELLRVVIAVDGPEK
ncbi:MAG TPA: hypothetical protein EYP49_15210, partial [Anaerolineae bacterium]|nr:hypothetical protein [Anaerolineae bacterium]